MTPGGLATFGARLRDLRTLDGLTQEQLADKLNAQLGTRYSYDTISGWERGKRTPRTKTIAALARIFDHSPCWLAFGGMY